MTGPDDDPQLPGASPAGDRADPRAASRHDAHQRATLDQRCDGRAGAQRCRLATGRLATDVYRLGLEARIDPAFALAIWRKESQLGTTGAAVATRNPGNLVCAAVRHPPAVSCDGRWAVYPTWRDAVADWYAYINRRYVAHGLTTVEAILPVYAPPSENDTAAYIEQVRSWMRAWGSGNVGGPEPGGGIMDDWIYRPLDQLIYSLERLAAATLWGINQAGLWLCDLIERLRTALISGGFRPAIDAVATGMLGISRPLFELGLVLGLVLVMLQPLVRIQLVNLRKLLLVAVIIPLLLPAGGAIFQDLEQVRADFGSLLYDTIFGEAQTGLAGIADDGSGSGQGLPAPDMGPLVAYNPANGSARHGVDVAAAYLYAVRADVIDPANPAPADLPDAFAAAYFAQAPAELGTADAAQRQQAIATAGVGILRMLYGILLVLFALCESGSNLIFTLGLGFLLIGLAVSLVFGFFTPVEHLTTRLAHQVLEAFLASWGISALQGVLMAAVFVVASSRNAVAVLGVGLLALVLTFAFLKVAFRTIQSAVFGAAGAITGGALDQAAITGGAALAQATVQGTGARLQAAGQTAYTGATQALRGGSETALGALEGAAAYRMARAAGNSGLYSATFAGASQSRRLAQLGTLATAMQGSEAARAEIEPALWAAQASRQEPLGLRAQRAVRRDGARAQQAAAGGAQASSDTAAQNIAAPPTTGGQP